MEAPAKALEICTHVPEHSGNKYLVDKCKGISQEQCFVEPGCHWNFDRDPSQEPGTCTHQEVERGNKQSYMLCNEIEDSVQCADAKICQWNPALEVVDDNQVHYTADGEGILFTSLCTAKHTSLFQSSQSICHALDFQSCTVHAGCQWKAKKSAEEEAEAKSSATLFLGIVIFAIVLTLSGLCIHRLKARNEEGIVKTSLGPRIQKTKISKSGHSFEQKEESPAKVLTDKMKNEYRENAKALGSVRMSLKKSYQQELEEDMAAQIEDDEADPEAVEIELQPTPKANEDDLHEVEVIPT